MSYYADGITVVDTGVGDFEGQLVSVTTTHSGKCLQCYLSGDLIASIVPDGALATFSLDGVGMSDVVFFLAVDEANRDTNYWSDAFPEAAANGNRITVAVPAVGTSYQPGDWLKVYSGDDGAAEATYLEYRREMFEGARYALGWGEGVWGVDWAFNGDNAIGWGNNWGFGPWGFDCEVITWRSEPLPIGTYPIKVTSIDSAGNESTAYEEDITINTYARPASALEVSAYDSETDTLSLAWTASDDF